VAVFSCRVLTNRVSAAGDILIGKTGETNKIRKEDVAIDFSRSDR
jgi:hypothetical protein